MTAKHTPGPWYTDISDAMIAVRARHEERDYGGGLTVAILGQFMEPGTDETHANARLIAAAPELLAALQNLVADFDKSVITTDPMLIEARAAIAKATAKEPTP